MKTTEEIKEIKKDLEELKQELENLKKSVIIPDYVLDRGWEEVKIWLKDNKK